MLRATVYCKRVPITSMVLPQTTLETLQNGSRKTSKCWKRVQNGWKDRKDRNKGKSTKKNCPKSTNFSSARKARSLSPKNPPPYPLHPSPSSIILFLNLLQSEDWKKPRKRMTEDSTLSTPLLRSIAMKERVYYTLHPPSQPRRIAEASAYSPLIGQSLKVRSSSKWGKPTYSEQCSYSSYPNLVRLIPTGQFYRSGDRSQQE
jgi:hypothetical protein